MAMIVSGMATTPDMDMVQDIIEPGAFAESIRERGLTGPRSVKLLAHHDPRQVIGRICKVEHRRDQGLFVEANIDEDISFGKDIAQQVRASGGLSFSVGFKVIDADLSEDAGGDILIVTLGDLFEVSVVPFPCNPAAQMIEVRDS